MIVALAATIVADRGAAMLGDMLAIGCIVATNRPSDAAIRVLYALHMSCWVADYELLSGCSISAMHA